MISQNWETNSVPADNPVFINPPLFCDHPEGSLQGSHHGSVSSFIQQIKRRSSHLSRAVMFENWHIFAPYNLKGGAFGVHCQRDHRVATACPPHPRLLVENPVRQRPSLVLDQQFVHDKSHLLFWHQGAPWPKEKSRVSERKFKSVQWRRKKVPTVGHNGNLP